MLFLTPTRHDPAAILAEQRRKCLAGDPGTIETLHALRDIAARTRVDLLAGDVSRIGARLHESWLAKRRLAGGITNPRIDGWYELALAEGASGGKIAGAGGGGFLLLHCEPERQERVTDALRRQGLVRMDFRLEPGGAMVIVNHLAGAGSTEAKAEAAASVHGAG